jgi:O-antigen/teichoic acid export membrane protein
MNDLKAKVIRGGAWVFALRIVGRGLGFIRTLILARLLAPEDFGLLGVAMLAISTLETFSQTGFQAALVQKQEDIEPYLDTAWTVSVIRGACLFIILFVAAPFIGGFFEAPKAINVIRTIALSVLLSGMSNIGVIYFQKELDFRKKFFYEFGIVTADLIVSVSIALILRNVWALVFGGLAGSLMRLTLSFTFHDYRPRLRLSIDQVRCLFSYGRWILGSQVVLLLINQGDDMLLGKMLGVTTLGFYQMAFVISSTPTTEISHVISAVMFPAYSKLQNDLQLMKIAFLNVLRLTSMVSFFLSGMIIFFHTEIVYLLFGPKWLPMAPAISVLCICGGIRSIGATIGPVLNAKGFPDFVTRLAFVKLIVLAFLIYPFTMAWGMLGTALAVLGATLVSNPIADYFVIKLLDCRLWEFTKPIAFSLLTTLFTVGFLVLLKPYYPIVVLTDLMVHLFFAGLFFVGAWIALCRLFGYGFKNFFHVIV